MFIKSTSSIPPSSTPQIQPFAHKNGGWENIAKLWGDAHDAWLPLGRHSGTSGLAVSTYGMVAVSAYDVVAVSAYGMVAVSA